MNPALVIMARLEAVHAHGYGVEPGALEFPCNRCVEPHPGRDHLDDEAMGTRVADQFHEFGPTQGFATEECDSLTPKSV
jgi:hypothetical protein